GAHIPDPHALGQGRWSLGHVRWWGGAGGGRLDRGREEPRPHHDHRGDHLLLHHRDLGPAPAVTTGDAGGRERAPAPANGRPRRSRAVRRHGPGRILGMVVLSVLVSACATSTGTAGASARSTRARAHAAPPLVPTNGGT